MPNYYNCTLQCIRQAAPTFGCKEMAGLCVHGRLTTPGAQQHVQQGQVTLLTSMLGAVCLRSDDVPHAEGQQAECSLVLVGLQAIAGRGG